MPRWQPRRAATGLPTSSVVTDSYDAPPLPNKPRDSIKTLYNLA
jgi:hypothetical protein